MGKGPTLTVVSNTFCPRVSATAIIMRNLLSSYTGNMSVVCGYELYATYDPTFLPPCPTRSLTLPRIYPRAYYCVRRRFPAITCRSIQGAIQRALVKLRATVVLAVFPYDDWLVATFLAARALSLPVYVYMQDLWLETLSAGTARARFAEKWEPVVLKEATRVICMNEAAQEHYEKKYDIQTDLLPHAIHEQDYLSAATALRPARMRKPTVLFVGGINPTFNLDALKVLASASELLPKEYELLYSTSTDMATLNRLGVRSSRLRVKYVPRAEALRLESEAHVLIAPLSHKNCPREEVRTLFSTKLLAYMLSGRPIIVFAPADSYLAESARAKGWGYAVTEDSPVALAAAIVKVLEDENLAARLVRGALQEARSRSAQQYAARLREWVETDAKSLS